MIYDWQIAPGELVDVYFNHTSNGPQLKGTVKYTPQATGDSWIIEDERGGIHYVQMFAQIVRAGLPDRTWP